MLFPARKRIGFHTQEIINPTTNALTSRYRTFEPDVITEEHTIAILGLGYVGLPLAVAFSKKYKTLGFDINAEKAALIASGVDPTNELDGDQLSHALTIAPSNHCRPHRSQLVQHLYHYRTYRHSSR